MAGKDIDMQEVVNDFLYTNKIILCKENKSFYKYSSSRGVWVRLDDIEFKKEIDKYINSCQYGLEWDSYTIEYISRLSSIKAVYMDAMDTSRRHIVLGNGVYDLESMEFGKFSEKLMATYALPFNYDAGAECPVYDSFIEGISSGSRAVADTLNEVLGCAIAGTNMAKKLVYLVGSGANGKSTYEEVLRMAAGKEYTTDVPVSDINGRNAFKRSLLMHSKLNLVHELDKKVTLENLFSANIKKIVTGEKIDAEIKYGDSYFFKPEFMLVIAGNHLPAINSVPQDSILRRYLVIDFKGDFTGSRRDEGILRKMEGECPGIFNRGIEGLKRLEANNCTYSCQGLSDRYIKDRINEAFPLNGFIDGCITGCAGSKVFYTELGECYSRWCGRNGLYPAGNRDGMSRELLNAVRKKGLQVSTGKSNGKRYIKGIKII